MVKTPHLYIAAHSSDGRPIYKTLRWCNQVTRTFHFTLHPSGIDGESRDDMSQDIDVRDLPQEFLPAVDRRDLMAGFCPDDQRPVDWLAKALDSGWLPAGKAAAAEQTAAKGTLQGVADSIRRHLHSGQCPGHGALGECPAAYEDEHHPGRFTAHVYVWRTGQQVLTPSAVAAWCESAGASDIVIRQDMHDPNNDTYDGVCHDGALSWIVDFSL